MFRVCLIFYTYDSANFKSINNTMKNATRYCAGPAGYRMCSTDVYCSKQTGSSSTKGNHHPSFSFLELGRRKLVDGAKICAAQKMLLKTETCATFVNGLLGFITLGIYNSLKRVCIAHNNCMSCPSIWATLSALPINILLGSSSCFCIVISLSEGEIIPFSGVCQSGGGCIIHAGGGGISRID